MKDYYNLFVELSLQQCTKDDYKDKLKVKAHNAAFKKLNQLQNEIKKNHNTDILYALLSHEDDRVKINAASLCLQINVLTQQAVLVLQKIIKYSSDSTICFSAAMLLESFSKKVLMKTVRQGTIAWRDEYEVSACKENIKKSILCKL